MFIIYLIWNKKVDSFATKEHTYCLFLLVHIELPHSLCGLTRDGAS